LKREVRIQFPGFLDGGVRGEIIASYNGWILILANLNVDTLVEALFEVSSSDRVERGPASDEDPPAPDGCAGLEAVGSENGVRRW
jgi:hypothetical protein